MGKKRIQQFIDYLKFPEPSKNKIKDELKDLESKELIPSLLELLVNTDSISTKEMIILALEHYAGTDAIHPLLDLILNEENKQLKIAAIKSIALLNYVGAIATLEKVVNRSADSDVIQISSQVIQILQGINPVYSIEEI